MKAIGRTFNCDPIVLKYVASKENIHSVENILLL